MTTQRTAHTRSSRLDIRSRLRRANPARTLPIETRSHLRNASREQLLAVRSILDAAIQRMDQRGSKRP